MKQLGLLCAIVCAVLVSCSRSIEPQYGQIIDTLYIPRYAEGFEILESTKGVVIKTTVQNSGQVEYTLISDEASVTSENLTVIPSSVNRVAVMSTSYIAFLAALEQQQSICGVSGAQYVSNADVLEMIAQGGVRDIGMEGAINYEVLSAIKPDVLLSYGLGSQNISAVAKLSELGVRSVSICDYMECSPLGRAEWIVAIGEIMGLRQQAIDIFRGIESRYLALNNLTNGLEKPKVMFNIPWRDTWYIPSPENYTVQLINDAGADYICDDNDSGRGQWGDGLSRAISSEQGFVWAQQADVWLNTNAVKSKAELLENNANFASTKPFQSGRIYNNNLRETEMGGSDFWENGVINPDVVLADLIKILHPELLPEHKLFYHRHIN